MHRLASVSSPCPCTISAVLRGGHELLSCRQVHAQHGSQLNLALLSCTEQLEAGQHPALNLGLAHANVMLRMRRNLQSRAELVTVQHFASQCRVDRSASGQDQTTNVQP